MQADVKLYNFGAGVIGLAYARELVSQKKNFIS